MKANLRIVVALSALVMATYAGSLGGSFHYDDFHSLVRNPAVRDLGNIPAFFKDPRLFSVDADKSMYRPLLLMTYALQHAAHDYQASGFLVGNILIHLGCVLLLWRLILHLGPGLGRGTAAVAAALFAVHPVAGEPVNYVSSRSESLAALCILGAVLLYLRARHDRRWWVGSLAIFLAGLLTKATVAVVPLLVGVHEIWRGAGWRQVGQRVVPYALLLGGYVTWLSSRQLLPDDRAEPVRSLSVQLATQLKAVSWYLHMLILPANLSVDPAFALGVWSSPKVWLGVALLMSAVVLLRSAGGAWRWWLLWPLVVAMPASAVPLNVLVNEHRIYLAAAGLCVPFTAIARRSGSGWLCHWPALCLVLILAVLSDQRNAVWEAEKTLWADAVAHGPHGARARVHLGNALREEGRLSAALGQFEQALVLEPQNLAAHANLASIYYEQAAGDEQRAELKSAVELSASAKLLAMAAQQYRHVLSIDAEHREALTNLGNVYRMRGDGVAAAQQYRQAAEVHPEHPDAWANLADLAFESGDYTQAAELRERVVTLEPTRSEGFRRLGDARALGGNLAAASEAYDRACRLDPDALGACYNLAETLRARGDAASAEGVDSALHLWTRSLDAYRHVLQQFGDYRQARRQEAALRRRLAAVGTGTR
jgi:tetratricopeptide (TPR) repeat protein